MKRSGEDLLRQSGLGYVIVRPADLLKEPGGYKALIFDQVGFGHAPCWTHAGYGLAHDARGWLALAGCS